MGAPKTIEVAVVEQLGALMAMGIYLVVMQHIMLSEILHKPQESWINRVKAWWLDEQLRAEKRKLAPWLHKESATEPSPQES
jgi:hypothetical protein